MTTVTNPSTGVPYQKADSVLDLIGCAQATLQSAETSAAKADCEGLVNRLRLAHGLVGRGLVLAHKQEEAFRGRR